MQFRDTFFKGNRQKLCEALPGRFIAVAAHSLLQSSADLAFPLRQDSSFWYLSGVNEPDLVLLIDTDSQKTTLVLPALNEYQQEWDGTLNTEKITAVSGIKDFTAADSLPGLLKEAQKKGKNLAYLKPLPERVEPYGFYANPARRILAEIVERLDPEPDDIRLEIARLRQVKQPVEIAALKQAIDVTASALETVQAKLSKFKDEKELVRAITAEFYARGADGHGYEPIVAGGANAAIIHYDNNDDVLRRNTLLLLDVGALVNGYSADISRTWVIGKPTKRHQELHDGVREMQEVAFKMLKPGVKLREYQKTMEQEAQKIMKRLGCSTADKPFPHGFSHFLGLDVHDAGDYDSPLVENSVLTVEPGLYLPDEGIGIRIEDNVRITAGGIEVLSDEISRKLL